MMRNISNMKKLNLKLKNFFVNLRDLLSISFSLYTHAMYIYYTMYKVLYIVVTMLIKFK